MTSDGMRPRMLATNEGKFVKTTDSNSSTTLCCTRSGAFALVLGALLAASSSLVQAQARDPKAVLKAMADYVGSQQTIALKFDSDIEVITPQLEKIQFTNSGDALLSRPNRMRAHRVGGYADVAMVFDGKAVDIYSRNLDAYAPFDAPGNVDQLFEALRAGHGVALPFADLLLSNSYDALIAGVMEAKHVGRGVVNGRECEHLAFRNFDTDWQLWVEVGDKPIPRKMVITSKTLNSAPQYTLRVTGWETGVVPAPNAFAFTPPASARKLNPDELIGLDELPQSTGAGK
jgi:hypothetical protein